MARKQRPSSRLADKLKEDLIERARRMRPEERLRAFVEHSRLMVELMRAGRRYQAALPLKSA